MILHSASHVSTNPNRRGVATMLAIILMLLMSGTVMAMALVFATQTNRTNAALAGAQLRQMLAAAIPIAREELAARGPVPRTVSPATPLEDGSLQLVFTSTSETEAQVQVVASWRAAKAVETLAFTRQATNSWTLQSLRLVASP